MTVLFAGLRAEPERLPGGIGQRGADPVRSELPSRQKVNAQRPAHLPKQAGLAGYPPSGMANKPLTSYGAWHKRTMRFWVASPRFCVRRFAKLFALDMLCPCGHVQSSRDDYACPPAREWNGVHMDKMPQDLMYLGNPFQLGLILLVVILLFGKGKVSDLMGDVAKGIKAFKKGLAEDEPAAPPAQTQPKPLDHQTAKTETGTPANTETGTRA
jgi:sec-independent protein translocase protein TatA